ncbi:MAG TPA: hypothetical protein VLZ30_10775 [Verrucomicrobiae bacterium]|nr:hypothetical protein [Verrucomicrobiae bacterium]
MRSERWFVAGSLVLGVFAFSVVLAYHRIVDGDLWARLAAGAHVWKTGAVMRHDAFAFTPTLPERIDHEWGAGVILFGLLNTFGPTSLMLFKIATACAALILCLVTARRNGTGWPALLLLAIPCGLAVLPGYITVVRSQTLTYLFFAVTLLCLEAMRAGRRWPAFIIVPVMLFWANVHGGFVVGLITIAVYAVFARTRAVLLTLLAAVAVTCINPFNRHLWTDLVPAWLHPRPAIPEWGPMPIWGSDPYFGFRILFVVVVLAIAAGWKQRSPRGRATDGSWVGLAMLALTAIAGCLHRRHAPFLGLTALVYTGPYLERWRIRIEPVSALYVGLAVVVAWKFLPQASLEPEVPGSFYPLGAVETLDQAGVEGNLAVPFRWGSYASWRLAPRIKVSIDGRYEEAYPDTTFEMNRAFFYQDGANWDQLLRQHRVDFIILELRTTRLRPDDLLARGYEEVRVDATAALFARHELAPALQETAARLSPPTRDLLDPHLADRWLE